MPNPPPWMRNSTGRDPSSAAGVHTLRTRQSSPSIPSVCGMPNTVRTSANLPPWGGPALCGLAGPGVSASRTPGHGAGGSGARNRAGMLA